MRKAKKPLLSSFKALNLCGIVQKKIPKWHNFFFLFIQKSRQTFEYHLIGTRESTSLTQTLYALQQHFLPASRSNNFNIDIVLNHQQSRKATPKKQNKNKLKAKQSKVKEKSQKRPYRVLATLNISGESDSFCCCSQTKKEK